MGLTRVVDDAVVADLLDIHVANGFATDIQEVSLEPTALERVTPPAAFLLPGGNIGSDDSQYTQSRGRRTQRTLLQLIVRGANPHQQMSDFIDDVGNSVERPTSHVNAAAVEIEDVVMTEASPVRTAGDLHNQWGFAVVQIETTYIYVRGSL